MKNIGLKVLLVVFLVHSLSPGIFSQENTNPSAVVAATKMNIVFAGLDNPIRIAVAGVPKSDVKVSVSAGKISRISDMDYIFQIQEIWKRPQKLTIWVSYPCVNGNCLDSQIFRILSVPRAQVAFASHHEGTITLAEVLKADSIVIERPLFLFDDIQYKVMYFEFITATAPFDSSGAHFAKTEGSKLTEEMKCYLKLLKNGDRIILTNIWVREVPTGRGPLKMGDIVLTVSNW